MGSYPTDWNKRKTALRNKFANTCQNCGIVLSDNSFHFWKGKHRRDTMFLQTHHIKPISEGGNHGIKNLTLLCTGCHAYKSGHEHLKDSPMVEEYFKIFRPYYFNKKRDELLGEIKKKLKNKSNIDKVRAILSKIKPHDKPMQAFEEDFDSLVAMASEQIKSNNLKKNVVKFDFTSVEQGLIMTHFYNGWNTFGILPTGSGKSLCFSAVAEALKDRGMTVVISPLISLMKDMRGKYNFSEAFNSALKVNQRKNIIAKIKKQKLPLLFLSPERLIVDNFKRLLESIQISRIVIDEAHCVADWGNSFRIKYLRIIDFINDYNKKHQKQIPILLLTATVTEKGMEKILDSLGLDSNKIAIVPGDLLRTNLHYRIARCKKDEEKIEKIRRVIRSRKKSKGIIFSLFANKGKKMKKSKDAESIADRLKDLKGVDVKFYHGKIPNMDERNEIQKWFSEKVTNKSKVLVATSAFGMGIDISDIRFVYHFYPPTSVEAYWQETGRAGRDGKTSYCVLFYSKGDLKRLQLSVTGFEKIAMIYEALVNGVIIIEKDKTSNKNFVRFISDLRKSKLISHQKETYRTISDIKFVVYKIVQGIGQKKLNHMWKIVRDYPNKFNGIRYKRITSLIELYSNRQWENGNLIYPIPASKGGNKIFSIKSVAKDMNVLLQAGAFEMLTMKDNQDRFLLIDDYFSPTDYARLNELIQRRKEDVEESKRLVETMVNKRNLQKFVNKFWMDEISKLRALRKN